MAFDYSVPSIDRPPVPTERPAATHLDRATRQWAAGRRIPLDLAVALMDEGYDVPALAASHQGAQA